MREFVRRISSLAFLPVAEVKAGMRLVRSQLLSMPEEFHHRLSDFVEYFDSTYVNGSLLTTLAEDGLRIVCRRGDNPIFPLEDWNVHEPTLVGGDRTNNHSETFNAAFKLAVGCTAPTLWHVIEEMQSRLRAAEEDILQYLRGEQPARKVHKNRTTLQKARRNLCFSYRNEELSMQEFLDALARLKVEE